MPTTCKVCRTESCVLLLDLSVRFAQHLAQGWRQGSYADYLQGLPDGVLRFIAGFKCSLRSTLKPGREEDRWSGSKKIEL
jgi:hypothetical protein